MTHRKNEYNVQRLMNNKLLRRVRKLYTTHHQDAVLQEWPQYQA